MKLKTLKDIDGTSYNGPITLMEGIKQEAIKWVKEHHIVPFGTFCEFHNITGEDLK